MLKFSIENLLRRSPTPISPPPTLAPYFVDCEEDEEHAPPLNLVG